MSSARGAITTKWVDRCSATGPTSQGWRSRRLDSELMRQPLPVRTAVRRRADGEGAADPADAVDRADRELGAAAAHVGGLDGQLDVAQPHRRGVARRLAVAQALRAGRGRRVRLRVPRLERLRAAQEQRLQRRGVPFPQGRLLARGRRGRRRGVRPARAAAAAGQEGRGEQRGRERAGQMASGGATRGLARRGRAEAGRLCRGRVRGGRARAGHGVNGSPGSLEASRPESQRSAEAPTSASGPSWRRPPWPSKRASSGACSRVWSEPGVVGSQP